MKNLVFLAAFLFAAFSIQAQTVNDEMEIQAFTRRFMAAYNAQDHAAIGKMYTDDAVRIDPEGKEINGHLGKTQGQMAGHPGDLQPRLEGEIDD